MKKSIIIAAISLLAVNVFVITTKENSSNRASLLASVFSPFKYATASDYGENSENEYGFVSHEQSCENVSDDPWSVAIKINSSKARTIETDFGTSVYATLPITKGPVSLNANASMEWTAGWTKAQEGDEYVYAGGSITVKPITSITATECPGTNSTPCPNKVDMNPCQTLKTQQRNILLGRYQ